MTPRSAPLVNLAGPFANLVLSRFCCSAPPGCSSTPARGVLGGVAFLGFLQVTALVLNLLPIPGLDGYAAPSRI